MAGVPEVIYDPTFNQVTVIEAGDTGWYLWVLREDGERPRRRTCSPGTKSETQSAIADSQIRRRSLPTFDAYSPSWASL